MCLCCPWQNWPSDRSHLAAELRAKKNFLQHRPYRCTPSSMKSRLATEAYQGSEALAPGQVMKLDWRRNTISRIPFWTCIHFLWRLCKDICFRSTGLLCFLLKNWDVHLAKTKAHLILFDCFFFSKLLYIAFIPLMWYFLHRQWLIMENLVQHLVWFWNICKIWMFFLIAVWAVAWWQILRIISLDFT